jgi:hypothetical protein
MGTLRHAWQPLGMVLGLAPRVSLTRCHGSKGTIRGQRESPPRWMLLGRGYQVPVCC